MTTQAQTGAPAAERTADEAELRNLAAAFSDAVNRRDLDAFRDLWEPHGVWDLSPMGKAEGIDAIMAWVSELLAGWELFVQMTHAGVVEVAGRDATMRWTMEEYGRSRDGRGAHNLGMYADRATRCPDGRWRFTRRTYHFRLVDEAPLTGTVFPVPPPTTAG